MKMYFVPQAERDSHESSNNLKKGMKLFKKIHVPVYENNDNSVGFYSELDLRYFSSSSNRNISLINYRSINKLVHYEIASDGFVSQHNNNLDAFYENHRVRHILKNKAVIVYHNSSHNRNNLIFLHLLGVPSTYLENFEIRNMPIDMVLPYDNYKVFYSDDSIIFHAQNQSRHSNWIVVLNIKVSNDNNCIVTEIYRKDLSENVESVISIFFIEKSNHKLLVQYQKERNSHETIDGFIVDMQTKAVLNLPPDFIILITDIMYFLNYSDSDIVIKLNQLANEIQILRYICNTKYSIKHVPFNFELYGYSGYEFISNRNNEVLMFLFVRDYSELHVFDLHDPGNTSLVFQGEQFMDWQCCISQTGNEIYIFQNDLLYVYFYKLPMKSLFSLAVDAVNRFYTVIELKKMNLPNHIYKFI